MVVGLICLIWGFLFFLLHQGHTKEKNKSCVFGVFFLLSRFQNVSLFMHDVFFAQTISLTCTQVRHSAVGHHLMFSVFPQLILQSEEKNRLSIILPHSPLLSLSV